MKQLVNLALMLGLGAAALSAQTRPVKMTISGTAAPSTIKLGGAASDYEFGGNGTLGPFTLRSVSASVPSTQPPSTCASPKLYAVTVGGAAVFRFQDGSLLKLHLVQGSDCIDLAAFQAHCIRVFQVTGGTGRLQAATGGMITLTETVVPVLVDASNHPAFSAITGDATGTVAFTVGAASQEDAQR